MMKTAGIVAAMLALGLVLAGCGGKDDGMERGQDSMENTAGRMEPAAGDSMEAASDEAADAGMMSEGGESMEAAPAERDPAEGE